MRSQFLFVALKQVPAKKCLKCRVGTTTSNLARAIANRYSKSQMSGVNKLRLCVSPNTIRVCACLAWLLLFCVVFFAVRSFEEKLSEYSVYPKFVFLAARLCYSYDEY